MKLKTILFILPLSVCFWVSTAKSQEQIGRDSVQVLKQEKEKLKLNSKLNSLKLKIVDEQKNQKKWNEELQEQTKTSLTYADKAKREALNMNEDGISSDKEAKRITKAAANSKKNADKITKLNAKIDKSQNKVEKLSKQIRKLERDLI